MFFTELSRGLNTNNFSFFSVKSWYIEEFREKLQWCTLWLSLLKSSKVCSGVCPAFWGGLTPSSTCVVLPTGAHNWEFQGGKKRNHPHCPTWPQLYDQKLCLLLMDHLLLQCYCDIPSSTWVGSIDARCL